jgi:AraC-like DNA-binding protein
LRPVEVRLARERPANPEAWRTFYGCPIKFGSDGDGIMLAADVVDEALPTANRQLAGTLDDILATQLAALDKDNIPARCKSRLIEQLSSGEISVDGMAKQLHMSRRTLQRKLSEAETTYEKLVDDTRRDLALRYMDEGAKSVSEVTFLLGFSGQSAFTRAFKRWTGASPTAYRESKAAPVG